MLISPTLYPAPCVAHDIRGLSEGSPIETFLIVQDINLTAAVKGRKLQVRAVVQIVDDLGNPVQGALVTVA